MLGWIKKHKILFAIICVIIIVALFGVPFLIHLLFKVNIKVEILQAEWSAGEFLGYYGAVLSFIGTVALGVLALYQNHIIKEESKKQADLLEERTRIENMPKFIISKADALPFCKKLYFCIKNTKGIAFDIRINNIQIKNGDLILWECEQSFRVPVLSSDSNFKINLNSPDFSDRNFVRLVASIRCKDKYDEEHEYLVSMYCLCSNNEYIYDDTEEVKKK